jgi:hypothetical protein
MPCRCGSGSGIIRSPFTAITPPPSYWPSGRGSDGRHAHHHTPDYPFTPQLGWTSTRSETFRSCRRRYFFQYYARYDRQLQLVRIQRLKSLSSIPTAGGQAVHDGVAGLLSLT